MIVARLETQKLLRRAKEALAIGNAGSNQHPINAGPGLVASGGMGRVKREQFLLDYPELVRLAQLAADHGLDSQGPLDPFGDAAA